MNFFDKKMTGLCYAIIYPADLNHVNTAHDKTNKPSGNQKACLS